MLSAFRQFKMAAAGAALAVLAGGCAMMEPKAERYVPPPLGTTWERLQTDTGSFGSGSAKTVSKRGERTWRGQTVVTFDLSEGTVFAQPDGAWLGIFNGDSPIVTFDPPQNFEFPLEVGKTWTRQQRMTFHPSNRTVTYSLTQTVEAIEDVTVPAGTFRTFKVSTVTSLGDENVVWFSPAHGLFIKVSNKRTAKHPRGPGTRTTDLVSYTRGG